MDLRASVEGAVRYLSDHPDEARYTDSPASAKLESGLRVSVTGPTGELLVTDMPASIGGSGTGPSPGWAFRAAVASCVCTLIALRAAQEDVALSRLEVEVDSESDDRGLLGIDSGVPAGPLSVAVRVAIEAEGVEPDRLREIASWGADHCPVLDATRRAVSVTVDVAPA